LKVRPTSEKMYCTEGNASVVSSSKRACKPLEIRSSCLRGIGRCSGFGVWVSSVTEAIPLGFRSCLTAACHNIIGRPP
jgi:hypothetical protein